MLSVQQNDLITRTGSGTPAGDLMRRYWQPAALVDELSGNRPVKPVRLFGEDLVIFKDERGRYGHRFPHQSAAHRADAGAHPGVAHAADAGRNTMAPFAVDAPI